MTKIHHFSPLESLDSRPNNLLAPSTSFVGREEELAEVKRLLSHHRLVTLTGVGGSGKTRLALRVAVDVLREYRDGVWLVELEALTDPALVPQAVASVLEVRQTPGWPILATLLARLQDQQMLLILDDCAHLAGACKDLVEALLPRCEKLRILATSRESLGARKEVTWRVPSLSYPDPQQHLTLERLFQYDAIQLFCERTLLRPSPSTVRAEDAEVMARICRRLDGISLAIEVAAGSVDGLPMKEIDDKLAERWRLRTGSSSTALPRGQIQGLVIDSSYEMLSPKEQCVLRRLSVFAGGATQEAAMAVCAADDLRPQAVPDLLECLVERSLVAREERVGEKWYRLHDMVREFCRKKLVHGSEAASVRGRHRDWYLRLAERADPELRGLDQQQWLERLDREHDNLRAALEWSCETGRTSGLRLAAALWRFWLMRGHIPEGLQQLDRFLAQTAASIESGVRAEALMGVGYLSFLHGDQRAAKPHLDKAWELSRKTGDKWLEALSLGYLGMVALFSRRFEEADQYLKESLRLSAEIKKRSHKDSDQRDSKWLEAEGLCALGWVAFERKEYVQAHSYQAESLQIKHQLGNLWSIPVSLWNLGNVETAEGYYPAARLHYEEALAIVQELGEVWRIPFVLAAIGWLAHLEGAPRRAAQIFGAVEAQWGAVGNLMPPAERARYDDHVAAVQGALGDEIFAAARNQGRKMTLEEAVAYATDYREETWARSNERRLFLIDKQFAEDLTQGETEELARLQDEMERYLAQRAPLPSRDWLDPGEPISRQVIDPQEQD